MCHPSVEGNLPLFPLGEGCPKGGVGVKNTPHKSEFVTPLSRGEFIFYSSRVRGSLKGGVEKNTPRYVLEC